MTVKERLIIFLKHENLGQKRFANIIGMSSGYVNAIKESIQPKTIHKIAMHFPHLNTGWLLTGEGEMLRKGDTGKEKVAGKVEPVADMVTMPREVFEMINRLTETLHSQQRTIESMEEQNKKTGAQPENNAGYAGVG